MAATFVRNSLQELRNIDYTTTSSKSQSITSSTTTMQFSHNVRSLCSRVHMMLRYRRRKQKRSLQISAPFNLQREPVSLPGISEDEITMLREKAAASRIGIADHTTQRTGHAPSLSCSLFSHPVRPPVITVHPPHATTSTESL